MDTKLATPAIFHTKSHIIPGARNDPNSTSQKSENPNSTSTTPATIEILAYGGRSLRNRMKQTIPIAIHVHPSMALNNSKLIFPLLLAGSTSFAVAQIRATPHRRGNPASLLRRFRLV